LTLKNPPPSPDSSLIASWEAAGPIAINCVEAGWAAGVQVMPERLRNPAGNEQNRGRGRERQHDVQQGADHVEKLPRRSVLRLDTPRITAAATAIAVAIELKLATVIPATHPKSDSVVLQA
jgi:hypothetical protein